MMRRFGMAGKFTDELDEIDQGTAENIVKLAGDEAAYAAAISGFGLASDEVDAALGRLRSLAAYLKEALEKKDSRLRQEWA